MTYHCETNNKGVIVFHDVNSSHVNNKTNTNTFPQLSVQNQSDSFSSI